MANLIETGLADLLKATTDNTQFLAKIARSIQQEQGEKAPQAARFYTLLGISGQVYQVSHPGAFVDNIQIIAEGTNQGHLFISDTLNFSMDQISDYLAVENGTYSPNANVAYPFLVIPAGGDLNIKTNQTLNIFPYSTTGGAKLVASIVVTFYNTLSHHAEQHIVEESMKTLRFDPEHPLRG